MTDIHPDQFEPKGTLQDEVDSDCFEERGITEESARRTWNTSIYMNSVYQWTPESRDVRSPDFSTSRL